MLCLIVAFCYGLNSFHCNYASKIVIIYSDQNTEYQYHRIKQWSKKVLILPTFFLFIGIILQAFLPINIGFTRFYLQFQKAIKLIFSIIQPNMFEYVRESFVFKKLRNGLPDLSKTNQQNYKKIDQKPGRKCSYKSFNQIFFKNFIQNILNMSKNYIRKDIKKLSRPQFIRFHVLLRMLHVFKPIDQQVGYFFYNYTYSEPQPTKVTPKCMYDSLISMHATCCEHRVQFFQYWHRWLLLQFEKYLLFAHKKLMKFDQESIRKEASQLFKIASKSHQNPKNQIQLASLLKEISSEYKNVIKDIPESQRNYIPICYWNLINFQQKIKYPKGFVSRSQIQNWAKLDRTSYDLILLSDKLIQYIWKQDGIYEINLETRFGYKFQKKQYNQQQQVYQKIVRRINSARRLRGRPDLTQREKQQKRQFVRRNYKRFVSIINQQKFWEKPNPQNSSFNFIKELMDGAQLVQFFSGRQIQQRKVQMKDNIIRFNVFKQHQINFIFGGKGYKYYPKAQQRYERDPRVNQFKNTRNNIIAYWHLGQCFRIPPSRFLIGFCTSKSTDTSAEDVHNMLHSSQSYFLDNASFSITSPLFFVFHAYLDLILETRILDFKATYPSFRPNNYRYTNYQKEAVQEVKNFFSKKIQILRLPISRTQSFRNNFGINNKINQQYPLLKYLEPRTYNYKIGSSMQGLQFSYRELMLSGKKGQETALKTLKDFNIEYQKNEDFNNNLSTIYLQKESQSQTNLGISPSTMVRSSKFSLQKQDDPQINIQDEQARKYVTLKIKYRTNIESTNFFINLNTINYLGQIQKVDSKLVSIFSKGPNAQFCPNCQDYQQITIKFSTEHIKRYFRKYELLLKQRIQEQKIIKDIKNSLERDEKSVKDLIEKKQNDVKKLNDFILRRYQELKEQTRKEQVRIIISNIQKEVENVKKLRDLQENQMNKLEQYLLIKKKQLKIISQIQQNKNNQINALSYLRPIIITFPIINIKFQLQMTRDALNYIVPQVPDAILQLSETVFDTKQNKQINKVIDLDAQQKELDPHLIDVNPGDQDRRFKITLKKRVENQQQVIQQYEFKASVSENQIRIIPKNKFEKNESRQRK